jgi:hypothetical protein
MEGVAVLIEQADPKGLVRESYRIDGITPGECRSIFVDWALSVPVGVEPGDALKVLVAHYALAAPEHPMTVVLTEALQPAKPPKRRGGRAARLDSAQS